MTSKKATTPEPASGLIFACDIVKFSNPSIADIDRSVIRTELQKMIASCLDISSDCTNYNCPDLGDGILILPPPTPKLEFFSHISQDLFECILDYNRTKRKLFTIKLRAALHFGEYFIDAPAITKKGVTGTPINDTCRILDSKQLRQWIDGTDSNFPMCLMISDKFFKEVISQQKPTLKSSFTPFKTNTKGRKLLAYAFNYNHSSFKSPNIPARRDADNQQAHTDIQILTKSSKDEKLLNELNERSIFVPIADIHNYNIYNRTAVNVPLINHLETALLFGDRLIMHCADPFRSKEVYAFLNEYDELIRVGKIVFLMSQKIRDVRKDCPAYFEKKKEQYLRSGYGDKDVATFKAIFSDKAHMNKVVELLDKSKFILRRGFDGTKKFIELIKSDLKKVEVLATDEMFDQSTLRELPLKLYQILHLQKIDDGKYRYFIGDKKRVNTLIREIIDIIDSESFSRNIFMNILRDHTRDLDNATSIKNIIDYVSMRVSMLHLLINIGEHSFTELCAERDRTSPYNFNQLSNHLSVISDCAKRESIGKDLVLTLKNMPDWKTFVNYHLSIMNDVALRRRIGFEISPERFYYENKKAKRFKNIAAAIRDFS